MKVCRFWLLLLFFFINSAFGNVLEGEMEPGYDVSYLHDSHAGYTNARWMKHIPNQTSISELSIPGTHNSLSLYGGNIPQTQTLSISSQLEMGIRFLDVRFKYSNGLLRAYHGPILQHQTFDELLSTVSVFLSDNNTEVILIRMQNEAGAENHQVAFEERFRTVLEQYIHNNYIPQSNNFKIGDARGKFVFIRDFNVTSRIGIERGSLFIQDSFRLSDNWALYSKWEKVLNHFNQLQHNASISLNYLSGSVGSFPYFVVSGKSSYGTHAPLLLTGVVTTNRNKWPDFPRTACLGTLCSIQFLGTNPLTSNWISRQAEGTKLGIVVTDFPGGLLVNNIIQNNKHFLVLSGSRFSRNQRVFDTWKGHKKGNVGVEYVYYNPETNNTDFFKLKKDNYGYFPMNAVSNSDWEYIGPKAWSDGDHGKKGSIYEYKNTYNNELEYFKLKKDGRYGYFPTDKSDNDNWTYMEVPRAWQEYEPDAKAGRLYIYDNPFNHDREVFKLKHNGEYGFFPTNKTSNQHWLYIDTVN